MRAGIRVVIVLGLLSAAAVMGGTLSVDPQSPLLRPEDGFWSREAPGRFQVRFTTDAGEFVVEAHRDWAPIGVDRFYNLVRAGFFDDSRFFRVRAGYIAQFGIPGKPAVSAVWRERALQDDPVRASNTRGTIAFAMTGPSTRTTQLFINLVDNTHLDSQGFAPIGEVIAGMEVVDQLYAGYDESAGGGMRRGQQDEMFAGGNAHLDRLFPRLSRLLRAVTLSPPAESPLVPIQSFVLDNGMTFLLVDRPGVSAVSAGWVVEAGSADDPDGRTGLGHMLEHMMFKGTRILGTTDLDALYAGAGTTGLNAVTLQDLTAYFVNVPAEKLELWFWLESDRLLQPAFRDFDTEKNVVVEERRLRIESTPTGRLEEELLARLWEDDSYGRPAVGHPQDLASLARDDAREYFASHYRAGNLTAVLVGPLDVEETRALADRYFGRLPRGPGVPRPRQISQRRVAGRPPLEATCDCRSQTHVLFQTIAFAHEDGAALEVLVGLLNGRSGRLHRSLVLEQEIAFSAFARHTPLRRGGYLSVIAEAKGTTTPAELLEAIDRELELLRIGTPTDRELQKVRNRLRADTIRRLKEPSKLMMELLIHVGLGEADHLNRLMIAVEAVEKEQIRRVAATYLTPGARTVGLFTRAGESGDVPRITDLKGSRP